MLKSGTGIKESPKKINVPALMEEMVAAVPKSITLDGISRMEVFQKVTVNVKVLEVKETVPVAGKRKQDDIAYYTGTAKVSLWEEHVDAVRDSECYLLKNFIIHYTYNACQAHDPSARAMDTRARMYMHVRT